MHLDYGGIAIKPVGFIKIYVYERTNKLQLYYAVL